MSDPDLTGTPDAQQHDLAGTPDAQQHDVERDLERVHTRSELLPEEQAVGSDDPEAQAAAVLGDSEERTEVPNAAPTTHLERRQPEDRL